MAQIIKRGPSYMVRVTWRATRTSNGWTFSGDGYTATVGDDGSVEHN